MGLFKKSQKLTDKTTEVIIGVSAVCVIKNLLPLAEYEVDGIKYKVRVPFDIAVKMEHYSEELPSFWGTYVDFGTNIVGQITKLQDCRVKVIYDPTKPKSASVVE